MRIGLVSDVHMGADDSETVAAELDALVERLQTFDPDAVVALGDLIANGSPEEDRMYLERVVDILAGVDAPLTCLRGNHDPKHVSRKTLASILGEPWGRVEESRVDLVYLDSSAPEIAGPRGEVSDEQLAFLDSELADADRAVVLVHHPVGYRDVSENVWFATRPEAAFCRNRERVCDVLERHDVAVVLNGHLHEADCLSHRNVGHVTIPSFNRSTPGSGVTGAWAELTVAETVRIRIHQGNGVKRLFVLSG